MTFLIKGKLEGESFYNENSDNRIKYYVHKVLPGSLKNDNDNLISVLSKY